MNRDRLYADAKENVADFVFDERVANVFPDMINRSVPGYGTIINMTGTLAAQRVKPGSCCYDLGCSLGAATQAIRSAVKNKDFLIVAVDNSPAMLAGARERLADKGQGPPVELICADIRHIRIRQASMVTLNFTLQFIPAADRLPLLQGIYEGMLPDGLLLLSEKIALPDDLTQQLFTEMHHGFKKTQGYSELEISQKRTALEDVLIPETLACHRQRLHKVGFSTVEVWFQCFNFVSLLAIK
ncbi:MAG: carboxy-S-adenosyl-L-methionine synthase CmoA [Candidatus Thiodiazotropha sp. (ex Epidulcina cf. delphinae)]|nr:carboxy-S-adenosyl-L-methionine synthase CmoA [Candidatus Thiodiazotropha sp. (ex Epidulcina cf. delphinae)]